MPRKQREIRHERRARWLMLASTLPGMLVALTLLWTGSFALKTQWTVTLLMVLGWWGLTAALQQHIVHPLRTVSNMLSALREGDFSLRARGAHPDDALGEVLIEVNALGETLRTQRLGALEATALLQKVLHEIDVAIFTFDEEERLRLVNPQGERLLGRPAERLLARTAAELGLSECLGGDTPRIVDVAFAAGTGRWEARHGSFRAGGLSHRLLVLSDVTRTLREEERLAWQRLVQVLRHEINNSLAPIDSLAGSLATLLDKDPRPDDWETDTREGLRIIRERSRSLNRFMTAYSQLTRLPRPRLAPVQIGECVRRVAELETRQPVIVVPGPDMVVQADGDQLDQLLINLVRNGVDATLETDGEVRIGWRRQAAKRDGWVELWVEDDGPGVPNTENLFVPFFTTKPTGTGIGLALSRQIAEAHGGRLTIRNREDDSGCRASLLLPLSR